MKDPIYNHCVIHGTVDVINDIYHCIDPDSEIFHFNHIYPAGAPHLTRYNNTTIPLDLDPDIHTTFDDYLEQWRQDRWGTPYNPYYVEVLYHTPTALIITFTSDDQAPNKFFTALKNTYTNGISIHCYSFDDNFSDTIEVYGDTDILNKYFTVYIDEDRPYSHTDNDSYLYSIEQQDIIFNFDHAAY